MGKIKYNNKAEELNFQKQTSFVNMQMIKQNGLVQYGKKYSIYYKLQYTEHSTGLFNLMRFYDLPFRILIDMKDKHAYLGFSEEYDSLKQAEDDLNILEKDFLLNMPSGYNLTRLSMSERLHLLQQISVGDSSYVNTEIFQKPGEWINDIALKGVVELPEYLKFGSETANYYQISACKRPEMLLSRKLSEEIRYMLLDFSNLSNHAMKLFMENNYLGLDDLERSIEKNPALYEVLFGKNEDDSRLYTLSGIYIIHSSCKPEFIKKPFSNFNPCIGMQKSLFKAFLPSGYMSTDQMHVCESSYMNDLTDWILNEGGIGL